MTIEKQPDYRDYMTHRRVFWEQKLEEEERRVRLYEGLDYDDKSNN